MNARTSISLAVLSAVAAAITLVASPLVSAQSPTTAPATGALDFVVKDIDGNDVKLADYKGKVVLIVNVASKCGFTKQYAGLEKLYKEKKDAGFVVLGFPANNFNGQEPGTEEEIKAFCSDKYDVTFPMFSKVSVKGDDKAPLFKFLTEPAVGGPNAGEATWNFNKYLIDRDGKLVAHYVSKVTPEDPTLVGTIDAALAKK
jgi:glutathione peroxidase